MRSGIFYGNNTLSTFFLSFSLVWNFLVHYLVYIKIFFKNSAEILVVGLRIKWNKDENILKEILGV